MIFAIDTNVVVALLNCDSPHHSKAVATINRAARDRDKILLLPMAVHESWVVLTRPKVANGLGWPQTVALVQLNAAMNTMSFVPDDPQLTKRWLDAVSAAGIISRRAHDWRLAVAAKMAGAEAILTFNTADFAGFDGLKVIEPA